MDQLEDVLPALNMGIFQPCEFTNGYLLLVTEPGSICICPLDGIQGRWFPKLPPKEPTSLSVLLELRTASPQFSPPFFHMKGGEETGRTTFCSLLYCPASSFRSLGNGDGVKHDVKNGSYLGWNQEIPSKKWKQTRKKKQTTSTKKGRKGFILYFQFLFAQIWSIGHCLRCPVDNDHSRIERNPLLHAILL